MKVMYGNRVNILMMANLLHVRFVGRNCHVEVVQHLRFGNTCVYCTRRRPMYRTTDRNSEFIQTNKRLYKRH